MGKCRTIVERLVRRVDHYTETIVNVGSEQGLLGLCVRLQGYAMVHHRRVVVLVKNVFDNSI